jgi:hypothetical protein
MAPEYAHNGNFKNRGVTYQGQIGVLSDVTSLDGTTTVFEPRKFVRKINHVNDVWKDTTGEYSLFYVITKWPNEDEYNDSAYVYGEKIFDNTPVVVYDLNIPGMIFEDYVTTDNTSGLKTKTQNSAVTVGWASASYGAPMYIDATAGSMGCWTLTYDEATTSKARAIFMEYANGYVRYMTTGAQARANY